MEMKGNYFLTFLPNFKKTNLAASPLKTPFRHGDLIDLNSPRNARSMAIEEVSERNN
jgi:hypothetical protein